MSGRDDVVVAALGGNSLLDPKLSPDVSSQFTRTAEALEPVAERIARGDRVVLTHGNGPQVGYMLLRSELSSGQIHEVPLDSIVADSQGAIGYMMQRVLREELSQRGCAKEVVTVVTEVEVDPLSATSVPTKPVGRFYGRDEADRLHEERGWQFVEDSGRGYRRTVVSPVPRSIVQLPTIRRLVDAGVVVIACGGGGIPVYRDADGHIRGIEGVVDKDRSSALLATELGARRMVITTGVDGVYRDYLSDDRTLLEEATPAKLRRMHAEGQFPPGSMGPKIEAAIEFIEAGGDEVVICLPEHYQEACEGRAGTRIREEKR